MNNEAPFRSILAVLLAVLALIRGYYRWLAASSGATVSWREGRGNAVLRGLGGLGGMLTLLAYIVRPGSLAWAALPLPRWARWLGAALGGAALAYLLWVHRALGANFSSTLHVTDRHTLVTQGPYRRVRHPMYTSFYLLLTAFFLLSANWFIGLVWLGGLSLVVAARLGKEEAVMIERFGDQYREYMGRTGRLLPQLKPRA